MSCHHKACQVQAHFANRIYAFDYLSESRAKCLQLKVSVSLSRKSRHAGQSHFQIFGIHPAILTFLSHVQGDITN